MSKDERISRVSDTKKYDDNFDLIFRRDSKKEDTQMNAIELFEMEEVNDCNHMNCTNSTPDLSGLTLRRKVDCDI